MVWQIDSKWYYAPMELMGKPGMPSDSNPIRGVKEMGLPLMAKKGLGISGKGWVIALENLPKETRDFLLEQLVKNVPVAPEAHTLPGFAASDRPVMKLPSRPNQTDRQRNAENARAALLAEVHRLMKAGSGKERAIQTLVKLAAEGQLPEHLQRLVPIANDKANEKRTLSRRTLWRWLDLEEKGRLAPHLSREKEFEVPAWGPWLLKFYRKPQKPSLKSALADTARHLPRDIAAPSYDAARRWLDKLGNVERVKGRLGPRELRTVLPFTRRSTEGLWPMDIVLPDGHCFDAEVQHPFHGQAFRPEITTYIDIATRKVVGWSVGLAESSALILEALRQMILTYGIPCVHYSDRGAYKAELFSHALTGILPRLGVEQEFSIAYNSQARGAIERLHQTLWVALAKLFSTYIGAPMDTQAKQVAFKTTRATGRGLLPFAEFLRLCAEQVEAYNAREHRSLGMSPNDAWAKAEADGWAPVLLEGDDLDELLPEVVRTVQRGEISLPWGKYFSNDLREWHGDEVRVRYDLHDGQRVWVRSLEGRLLATAQRYGNRQPYFSESAMDHARDQREKGRIDRLERKIGEAQAERRGYLDVLPEAVLPLDLQLTKTRMELRHEDEVLPANLPEPPLGMGERGLVDPFAESIAPPLALDSPEARYAHWKRLNGRLERGEELTEDEQQRWQRYPRSNEFAAQVRKEAEQAGDGGLDEMAPRRANASGA
jgi:putative transposase